MMITQGQKPLTLSFVNYTVAKDAVPKDEVVLKLIDFRFEIEGRLHRGPQVIRVETPGPTMHEVDFFRLHDGRTVADLKRWRKENPGGPALRMRWEARSTVTTSRELYG